METTRNFKTNFNTKYLKQVKHLCADYKHEWNLRVLHPRIDFWTRLNLNELKWSFVCTCSSLYRDRTMNISLRTYITIPNFSALPFLDSQILLFPCFCYTTPFLFSRFIAHITCRRDTGRKWRVRLEWRVGLGHLAKEKRRREGKPGLRHKDPW